MSYTFRIVFEGICAYVPDKPFFEKQGGRWVAGSPTQVQILFPDITGRNSRSGISIRPHFLTLKVRARELHAETDRPCQLIFREPNRLEETALFRVDGEEIEFDVKSTSTAFSFANWVPAKAQEKPNLESAPQRLSLYWLPRLEEISTAFDKILPDLLAPNRLRDELAGRLMINRGVLHVAGFNQERGTDKLQIWRFADPKDDQGPGVWRRAIGNRLALDLPGIEGVAQIILSTPKARRNRVVLAPLPGTHGDIEVTLSNVEPENLFGAPSRFRGFDPDFDVFYDLCTPSSSAERPVPNPPSTVFDGAFEKPCSGSGINR